MAEEGTAVAGSPEGGGAEGSAQAGGGGTTSLPDWGTIKAGLGDLAKDKSLEPYKDLQGLVKSHIEAQKLIGRSVQLPGKDMKPEDRSKAVKDIIGRLRKEGVLEATPDSPDKYELKTPQLDGWKANEPLLNGFKEAAHKIGMTPSQAQGLFDWYLNYQESSDTQEHTEFEEMKAGLQREWGGLFRRKIEAARRAASKFIGADADELISRLPPAAGRRLVQAFADIGEPLLEEAIVSGEMAGLKDTQPATIKAKMEAMLYDKAHPLNDVSHAGHKQAVDDYNKLNEMYVKSGGR